MNLTDMRVIVRRDLHDEDAANYRWTKKRAASLMVTRDSSIGTYILDKGLGQQTCKACGRPDRFNFHVPDKVWASIIPPELQTKVVCLYCFDEFAHKCGVDYSQDIKTLYFVGEQAIFEFSVVWGKGVTC